MKELCHLTLGCTSPEMVMEDGLLTIHLKFPKLKRNLINTHYRHHRTYRQTGMLCHRTGMITLSTSRYSSTIKVLLEYSYGQSQHCGLIHVDYHISVLSQYMTRPSENLNYETGYMLCVKQVFADDRLTRKSQQGHLIFYNSGPIIWKRNRQHTISLSTTETELDSFQWVKQNRFLDLDRHDSAYPSGPH
jgi:hypothetical protein